MRAAEEGRGGEEPRKVTPLGYDRDLGAGQSWKVGGKHTRCTSFTGMRCGTPGAGRNLGRRPRTEKKVSAGMSGGGWWVGVKSMWMDASRTGELGGISGYNR